MSNPTNRKGADFERDILPWIKVLWPKARRSGVGFDGSDYINTDQASIEAKCRKDMRLGTWFKQAKVNAINEGKRWPVVIHKRRHFGAHQAYVSMTLEDWVEMLADARGIELPEDLYPVSEQDDVPDWSDEGIA